MTRLEVDAVRASRSKRTPLETKNTGMKKPNPIASSLRRKSGCVIAWSRSASETIAPATNAPRMTSSPSASATAAKPTNSSRAARADLRGRVLQAQQVRADAHRVLRPAQDGEDHPGEREQRAEQQQRRPGPALAGEEQRQQDDRPEVRDRRGGDDQLPEGRGDLAGVLEHRHQHAQRRGAQDDRD